jgi:tetratricopeptide (TPR) repeat protein
LCLWLAGRGDILLTSRNQGLDRLGTLLKVPPMTAEDGVSLLLRGYRGQEIKQYMAEGSKIVSRLGGLPLAIDQAAAYLGYKRMPLERLGDFLEIYEAQKDKILKYTSKYFWEYGTMQMHGEEERNKAISAFTTWEMSFQQLESDDERRKKNAAHFLTLSAFLDPSNIGESMFRNLWAAGTGRPEWMHIFSTCEDIDSDEERSPNIVDSDNGESDGLALCNHPPSQEADEGGVVLRNRVIWDTEKFWELIYQCLQLSLLQSISSGADYEGASFSLHPLIRDWLQLRERPKRRRVYLQEAVDLVLACIKSCETLATGHREKRWLLAHMDACLSNDQRFSEQQCFLGQDAESCVAASWFSNFYSDQGRYSESERLENLIIETRKRVLGQEHPSTLASMANLASTYSIQGRWKEAEELGVQVIETSKRVLGQEHPDTLTSMANLASTYQNQGRWKEAEELGVQVMETRKRVLGQEHPATLISMGNLASTYLNQGRWKEAEELEVRIKETTS